MSGKRVSPGLSPRDVVVAAAVVALVGSCAGSATTSRGPSVAAAPVLAAPAAPSRKAVTPVELPPMHVVLDEPRFVAVRERERAKDWTAAARAFDAARGTTEAGVNVGVQVACALDFVSGRLHFAAGEYPEAAAAFIEPRPRRRARSRRTGRYAPLRRTRGRAGERAIARARGVPEDAVVGADAKVVVAEALAAGGDRLAAVAMWRALLAANPHGPRWVDTSVKLATALLDGVDGDPGGARAIEALDVATRVVVDAPKLADASGAQAARDRAVALLRVSDRRPPTRSTTRDVRGAQAWLDANEPSHAIADAAVAARIGATTPRHRSTPLQGRHHARAGHREAARPDRRRMGRTRSRAAWARMRW